MTVDTGPTKVPLHKDETGHRYNRSAKSVLEPKVCSEFLDICSMYEAVVHGMTVVSPVLVVCSREACTARRLLVAGPSCYPSV